MTATDQRDIDPMIRSIDNSHKYKQPKLVSPTSNVLIPLRDYVVWGLKLQNDTEVAINSCYLAGFNLLMT